MNLLCRLNRHKWKLITENHRKCIRCNIEQWKCPHYINEGGEKNFYGYIWSDKEVEFNSNPFYSGIDL